MADEWANWTQDVWNAKLLDAVFVGSGEIILPVSRIDATEGFLARVAEAEPEMGREVLQSFVDAHKSSATRGRKLFDPGLLHGWDPKTDEPNFFSQLYLSLIVASATAETHSEGNFRERLAIVLGLDRAPQVRRKGLPRLWHALALWSREQSKLGLPIRPLRLPDPGHETIIGYSKRLAFPMYKDQVQLARLLSVREISAESPIADILQVIGRNIRRFSNQFSEEYQQFRRAVEENDPETTATPFWSALEETTWSSDRVLVDSRRPSARLELEIASGAHPSFELLVDRLDCGDLPDGWRIESLPIPVSGFAGYLSYADEAQGGDVSSAILGLQPIASALLRGNYIEQQIHQGCLCFAPGESIAWTSCAHLPSSGTSWLVMRNDIAKEAKDVLSNHGVSYWEQIHAADSWLLVGPIDCNRSIPDASWRRPFSELSVFKRAISRSRVSLRGAIRLSDGVLFLKPAIPTVVAPNAEKVLFTSVGDGDDSAQEMLRSPSDANSFLFPPSALSSSQVPGTLVLAAYRDDQLIQARRIQTVGACTTTDCRSPKDIHGWLIEGDCGQISVVNTSLEPIESPPKNLNGRGWTGSKAGRRYLDRSRLQLTSLETANSFRWQPVESMPTDWTDVFESLIGLLTCRRGVDYTTAVELLVRGFDLDSERIASRILDGLTENQQLVRLYARRWRGQRFFCRQPVMVTRGSDAGLEVRMVGLLSKLRRSRLLEEAHSLGMSVSISVLGDWSHAGAIRIEGASRENAVELAGRMEIDLRDGLDFVDQAPLVDPRQVLSRISSRIDIRMSSEEKRYWEPESCNFWASAPESELSMEANYAERQQPVYILRAREEPVWATQSRPWASFIAQYLLGRSNLEMTSTGALVAPFLTPGEFSRNAVFFGAGVCGTDWRADHQGWHYPFANLDDATNFLVHWMRPEHSAVPDALARWAAAMENTPATSSQASAFKDRYRVC